MFDVKSEDVEDLRHKVDAIKELCWSVQTPVQ